MSHGSSALPLTTASTDLIGTEKEKKAQILITEKKLF
jgi:hypothetical protein